MKPILFNTEMVKAILDGRKTTTRRLIKPHYRNDEYGFNVWHNEEAKRYVVEKYDEDERDFEQTRYINSPYEVGDVLYVRETFNSDWRDHTIYKADGGSAKAAGYAAEPKWHPSIHMPKEAARIFLRVTDVKAERLQEIDKYWSNYDKEGMRNPKIENISIAMQEKFISIWNSTVKKLTSTSTAGMPIRGYGL